MTALRPCSLTPDRQAHSSIGRLGTSCESEIWPLCSSYVLFMFLSISGAAGTPLLRVRRRSLRAGAVLGRTAGQDQLSSASGVAPRRRNRLSPDGRSCGAGRLVRILYCSLCLKRNAVTARVPETALTLIDGEHALTLYQWNTHRARHYFCRNCGIYVFHKKRAAPDHYA